MTLRRHPFGYSLLVVISLVFGAKPPMSDGVEPGVHITPAVGGGLCSVTAMNR